MRAFPNYSNDQIVGLSKFADTDRYDVVAKVTLPPQAPPNLDVETAAPLLFSLLKERFKLAYHTEDGAEAHRQLMGLAGCS